MGKRTAGQAPRGQGVRRRLPRGRNARWSRDLLNFVVPLAVGTSIASSAHATWYYRSLADALASVLLVLTAIAASVHAKRMAQRAPRPRLIYLAMACGWLAVAVLSTMTGWGLRAEDSWQVNALGWAMILCSIQTLAMLGRAATAGRLRRYFWLYPPTGLG